MVSLLKKVLEIYNKQSAGKKYFLLSCLVTVVDYVILFVLYTMIGIELVVANTIAVVAGFLLHYILGSNTVFKTPYGAYGFLVYVTTFLLGLFLADTIIHYSTNLIAEYFNFGDTITMTISKMLSVILPYFVLYYIRKLFFNILRSKFKSSIVN